MMPGVIARTDLVGTMPGRVPGSMVQPAALQILPLPFELPELPVHAIWHERMQDNGAHRWLRSLVQEIGKAL
jgi:DNA-binding transcriptional LysR family regulator